MTVGVCIAEDVFELMLGTRGLRLLAIFRHVQPLLDEVLIRLQMELQPIGAVPKRNAWLGQVGLLAR